MSDSYEQQLRASLFSGGNAAYLEELYELFLEDPQSIAPEWREFFAGFRAAGAAGGDVPHGPIIAEFERRAREPRRAVAAGGMDPVMIEKQAAVMRLIEAYRTRGHRHARLDPLGLAPLPKEPDLELAHYGLSDADLDTEFSTVSLTGPDRMKLRDILAMLRSTYAGTIGFEFQHISVSEERGWLKDRIETSRGRIALSAEERKHLLEQLTAAEGLEKYLHTRFVGQKRFSLEGGESFIPLLSDVIQQGGAAGVQEMVIGMAHRGRLNVLINVLGKSPRELFSEFEGVYDPKVTDRSGDVKYHLGFSSDISTPGGNVHLALAFNPSHLEIVNPVVEGSVRARQDRRGDVRGDKVMPILVHGDAAFAGQGVVMETLQLSQARGFYTGGTVHIVINNQVGFTISNPADARSTPYATDVAKMLEAPILHVNGDDAEAVIFAARLAVEYRMKFHKDIVIDLVCYRRHGHNEADEPSATQPVMYKIIKQHKTTRELYAEKLQQEGVIAETDARRMVENYRAGLDEGRTVAPAVLGMIGNEYTADWSRFQQHAMDVEVDTSIDETRLRRLGEAITTVPENFRLHGRVQKIVDDRRKMLAGEQPMDWGFAETMAYAALMSDRFSVRLTGQDAGRGTFFHRHAVLHDQVTGEAFMPLRSLVANPEHAMVIDSLLSEEAVMAFEYGYSTAEPTTLNIWEGQFGDFANGAQVVIDQFITSGEAKWDRLCGLVLFLPHGYEGQGPEHSSARLERFLQLCALENIQVCTPTTPAQMFHMLRRQMLRATRKPLVVMTPKSMLRHKLSVSTLDELAKGGFQELIPDSTCKDPKKARRVVVCGGKVYWDLVEAAEAKKIKDVAIVRIEQLYPFPRPALAAELKRFGAAREVVWCQEEPMNQGAWYQIRHHLDFCLAKGQSLSYAGRARSAAPACGHLATHNAEQAALIEDALVNAPNGHTAE